jgi:hypothetical protein
VIGAFGCSNTDGREGQLRIKEFKTPWIGLGTGGNPAFISASNVSVRVDMANGAQARYEDVAAPNGVIGF